MNFSSTPPYAEAVSSVAPQCTHSIVRIFPNNVLPCPVVHQQNSRTPHGMYQPPLRSSQVRTATHPNSTYRLIASRQLLEIDLTYSQQTRKLFLIASFSG